MQLVILNDKGEFLGSDGRFYQEYPEAVIITSIVRGLKVFEMTEGATRLVEDYGLETQNELQVVWVK